MKKPVKAVPLAVLRLRCEQARQFAASPSSKTTEPKAGEQSPATEPGPIATEPRPAGPTPSFSPASTLAARFLTWADALQPKIDHAGRPMSQNPTPKRNREYQSRMIDCRNMERLQKALQVLADAHEAGTIPTELTGLKTRDEIGAMVRKYVDGSKGGYYSAIESLDYADKTPTARLLQDLIEGNPEQRAERERLHRIETLKAEIALSTIPGYFPTSAPIVQTMLNRARLEPGLTVLEPSAGSGNIADALRDRFPTMQTHCFELNTRLAELLKLKGHYVGGDDFMTDDRIARIYDRVIMNPPFEKQADIDHVRKAFSLLKPGGVLVSVMAPGFEFRQDRKSTEFRAWLDEVGGTWEDLPDGAFKASGTGINTRLVVIEG
jgi:phospholipid N-methyltransferase